MTDREKFVVFRNYFIEQGYDADTIVASIIDTAVTHIDRDAVEGVASLAYDSGYNMLRLSIKIEPEFVSA